MLKVYICPKCKAVRYVSKFRTYCYKCDMDMVQCIRSYEDYINLDSSDRDTIIEESISV